MDKQGLVQGLAAGAIGFGVMGAVAPGTLLRIYGADPTPSTRSMTRLWGTRNVVLGVLTLQLRGDAQDTMLSAAMYLNLADSLLGVIGPALDNSPAKTGLLAAASSGLFAGIAGYAKSLD
jgi:hypothetical protein